MENVLDTVQLVNFTTTFILLVLQASERLHTLQQRMHENCHSDDDMPPIDDIQGSSLDLSILSSIVLHNVRLCSAYLVHNEDIGYWVKPRSTTWFSRFLMEEYTDDRWVQSFRMSKAAVHSLASLLAPNLKKKDTRFRLSIPVIIRVACSLFKLAHGCSLLLCSELFAVGRSTVSEMLKDTVLAINVVLRHEIKWPIGNRSVESQLGFKAICGLPGVVGAIDGTHVSISKPSVGADDYYHFKSGGYTMNCQAVVDSKKRFLDLYIGMPGSTHDMRVLRRSSLYRMALYENLFDARFGLEGFSPYLIGDSGYPLMSWLMVPHRVHRRFTVLESLFNRRLRAGRCVVENAFGILKQTWCELLSKSDLHVLFMPDVITACCILHNILLGQSADEVAALLAVLHEEGLHGALVEGDDDEAVELEDAVQEQTISNAEEKRSLIGVYLAGGRHFARQVT